MEAASTHDDPLLAGMDGDFAQRLGVGAVDEERVVEVERQARWATVETTLDGPGFRGAAEMAFAGEGDDVAEFGKGHKFDL